MLKEIQEKFHCYGSNDVFNKDYCIDECCRFLTGCMIMAGHNIPGKQWEVIDKIHEFHTSGEVIELLQINFQISYNAAKMSIKRWRQRQHGNRKSKR
jgi:hypothetical protein